MANKFNKTSCGISFFFVVLTLGMVLALFQSGFGGGGSIRIPLTNLSLSAGGSIGKKEIIKQALPNYLRSRVASNKDFFNHSSTMTIWMAEGMGVLVFGQQPEAPALDLNLTLIK